MDYYCYANGKIIKTSQAKIPVTDLAVLRGYAVFDFVRVYNGKAFHLADHLKRFKRSASLLGLKLKLNPIEIEKLVYILIKKNKKLEISLRFILTGGLSSDGLSPENKQSQLFILVADWHSLPAKTYTVGGRLITSDYLRTFPTSKNTGYIMASALQKEIKKNKAVEVLYLNQGNILECSTSNIFLVKDNHLITPKENVLAGVTRKIVLTLAKKDKNLKIEERDVKIEEIKTADEIFITATNKLVAPIVKIDNWQVANGKIGLVTSFLLEEYKKEIKKECY